MFGRLAIYVRVERQEAAYLLKATIIVIPFNANETARINACLAAVVLRGVLAFGIY